MWCVLRINYLHVRNEYYQKSSDFVRKQMNVCDNRMFIYPDTVFRRQMERVLPHRYSGVILAGYYTHHRYRCPLFLYTHLCLKQKTKISVI